jgi:hypothetical protein
MSAAMEIQTALPMFHWSIISMEYKSISQYVRICRNQYGGCETGSSFSSHWVMPIYKILAIFAFVTTAKTFQRWPVSILQSNGYNPESKWRA